MARILESRSDPNFKIGPEDQYTIEYDLRRIAMFCPEPIEVEIPSVGMKFQAGRGYGGFSWTIFQRGEGCTACGRCCHRTFRRIWLWVPGQPQPGGLPKVAMIMNGKKFWVPYHMQANGVQGERCDYLIPNIVKGKHVEEENGIPMWLCGLHGEEDPTDYIDGQSIRKPDIKPTHCKLNPFMDVHTINGKRGKRDVLARRLPSRNWRWPKCPIDVYNMPITSAVAENDRTSLWEFFDGYRKLPGLRMAEGLDLWEELMEKALTGNPPQETVYFEDLPQFQ